MHQWQQIIVVVSVLSMVLGAVAAIGQTNIKRLMAYSSIGHMGYALLGLAAGTQHGVQGMLVYLAYLSRHQSRHVRLCRSHAPRRRERGGHPPILPALRARSRSFALALAALTFSLAGLPPLAGIFAKVYVFVAAMQAHLYHSGHHQHCGQRGGRVLLSAHRQDHVFRRAGGGFDHDIGHGTSAIMWGASAISMFFVFVPAPLIAMPVRLRMRCSRELAQGLCA